MPENKQTLLRSIIASHFQTLLDRYGFKEAKYHYDSKHFGNETLDFRSPNLVLRFTTDRGCLGIDIRLTTDSRWTELSGFLEFLGYPLDVTNVENVAGVIRAEDLAPVYARALAEHFETILDLQQPHNFEKTQIQFRAFLKERGKRLFGIEE